MKSNIYSRFCLGLFLYAFAYVSATPTFGYPKFINEWAAEITSIAASRSLKIDTAKKLEDLLASEINLDNFDVTCSALLQSVIKEVPVHGSEMSFLNIDSALDICALINPWNSMECGGVTGVVASYARSIQEFVRNKDNTKGDLRAACIVASAISPGRPFAPITRGSIKSKCEEVCSGDISKTISSIDASFCSLSTDLCNAVDFTLYNAFSSLNERELGIAVATSILLSEGSLGLRTSYREGCRFVLSLKQKGTLPTVPSDVSEPIIFSSITEFYKTKLSESGLLLPTDSGSRSSESVFLKVLVSQITKATKTILEAKISKKPAATSTATSTATKFRKPAVASTHITSSEFSPLSEYMDDSLSSEYKVSKQDTKHSHSHPHSESSTALESWFNTLKESIKKGTKDIDTEFDESLNKVVSSIDSSSVYSSCVSGLKSYGLASHRRAVEACRKIDPFSSSKCQKLNHFELMFMITLREDLERYGKNLVVDLRDLCAVSPNMSLSNFLKIRNEELSDICIRALRKGFKSKYSVSDRVIRKACIKADYFRASSCGSLVSGHNPERINIVFSLAEALFDKRNDKERLQATRDSVFNVPSYRDLCDTMEKAPVEAVEDCIFGLRESLSKFKSIASILNIEGACISSLESSHGFYPFYGYVHQTGIYGPETYDDRYFHGYDHLPYPGRYPHMARTRTIKRFYKDIVHSPFVSSLPWIKRDLPKGIKHPLKYLEQEYSESRRGFYKDASGKTVYHDGNRYLLDGFWFIKVGNDWYIDHSSTIDFVKILPGDPRYNPYPLSMYGTSPDSTGVLQRKTFHAYTYPPHYTGTKSYISRYQELYGRPTVAVDAYYPHIVTSQKPLYKKCRNCRNWIPYDHDHEHDHDHSKDDPKHDIYTKDAPTYDPVSGLFITRQKYYDSTSGIVETKETASTHQDSLPLPGTREIGVQTQSEE